jgi:hypothetical protein
LTGTPSAPSPPPNAAVSSTIWNRKRWTPLLRVGERFIEPSGNNWHIYILVLNHIQTIYQDQKDFDQGLEYARKILCFAQTVQHDDPEQRRFFRQWQGLASVDIASMLVGQGKFAEGETYADQGLRTGKSEHPVGHYDRPKPRIRSLAGTRLAAQLRLELEKLSASGERSQYLEQLMQSTILTEDDWLRFQTVFEKVHPGFMEEQKALYPDLTPAELRYLVLEKLQLSTHEMANMLGVSDKTVRQTRVRLRRKTG